MHAPAAQVRPSPGFIALLGALTAFGALSIDLYLPALPIMGAALGVPSAATQQTITAFLLGVAGGQLFYGPISDRHGRKGPLVGGIVLYIAASVACAMAPTLEWLIAARFVQGLGGCAGMVIARAAVRDRHDHKDTARIFTYLTLVFGLAPVLAPLGGSLLLMLTGWRSIFWALAAFGVTVLVAAIAAFPESRGADARAKARTESYARSYALLLRDRRLLGYLLAAAFGSSSLFAYVSASATVFISDFGLTPMQYSLVFGANALAMVGAAQINRAALSRRSPDAIAGHALLAGAIIACGFALAAWAGLADLRVTIAATFLLMGAFGFFAGNLAAGALSVSPERAGAIASLTGVAGFGIGALVAGIASALHDGTALPLAGTMAAAHLIALGCFRLMGAAR